MRHSFGQCSEARIWQHHLHPCQSCCILETIRFSPKPQRWSHIFLKAKSVHDLGPKPLSLTHLVLFFSTCPFSSSFFFLFHFPWLLGLPPEPYLFIFDLDFPLAGGLDFLSGQALIPFFTKPVWRTHQGHVPGCAPGGVPGTRREGREHMPPEGKGREVGVVRQSLRTHSLCVLGREVLSGWGERSCPEE